MAEKRLFLYPGAHKTATSLLQAALEANRPKLEESGISVLRRQKCYKVGLHKLLGVRNSATEQSADVWQELLGETLGRDFNERDIVLSLENLFGEFVYPYYRNMGNCIENLQILFPDHKIEFTFYVRRQDTFLESLYIQQVQRGSIEDVETFWARYRLHPIDWMQLLRPAYKRLGRKSVKIRAFEKIKDGPRRYITQFFRDFSDLPSKDILANYSDLSHTNLSLSDLGLRISQAAFSEIPELKHRRRLTRALQSEFGNDKFSRFHMPDEVRQEIIDLHKNCNADLIKRTKIPTSLVDYYRFEDCPP